MCVTHVRVCDTCVCVCVWHGCVVLGGAGLPLRDPTMRVNAAIMVNVLVFVTLTADMFILGTEVAHANQVRRSQ